jgi:hypothetical protein
VTSARRAPDNAGLAQKGLSENYITNSERVMLGKLFTGPASFALVVAASSVALGQSDSVPQFNAYQSKTHDTNWTTAPLHLDSAIARQYRTRLREEVKLPPNFAGKYRLVQWGCGTTCILGAVIDRKTGRIIPLPFSVCCSAAQDERFQAIEFRPDSRLIIFRGLRNEQGVDGSHFYTFDGHRFSFVKTVSVGTLPRQ